MHLCSNTGHVPSADGQRQRIGEDVFVKLFDEITYFL